MNKDEPLQPSHTSTSPPTLKQPSPTISPLEHTPQQHPLQNLQPLSPQPSAYRSLPEFPQGEDIQPSNVAKNTVLSSRIGSTGSQLVAQVNEVRKRNGRRVLHRPKPLDLDHTRLHGNINDQQQTSAASGSGSESRPSSAVPMTASGSGPGLLLPPSPTTKKEPKHRAKFPLLQIKTDLTQSSSSRRPTLATATATSQHYSTHNVSNNHDQATNYTAGGDHQQQQPQQRKPPSKWQIGLERMLKKIQRRKRAPSNLVWYAAHSTESYLSGATLDARSGSSNEVDTDADSLHYGHDKPPQWVVDSLRGDALFFSDDTVELVIALRDYLIKATESGWNIAELKDEIVSTRRSRSASPHGSPLRASPVSNSSAPPSPGGASQGSPNSSRRNSRSSFELDYFSQHAAGRYVEEDEGSYRLLDYFLAILSDIISHDCRYRVQHPRPLRPEWALHSIVLDVLLYLSKVLAHDHKAVYDIGMIALSALPVFKNNTLIRLLNLLTDIILPSFASSRTTLHAAAVPPSPIASLNPGSPRSPSQIRVQLDNNQTFAIKVHSPTEEMGLLAVPRQGGPSLHSPRIPNLKSSSSSISRGPQTQAQDILDSHADSLISLTLLAVLEQLSFTKSALPVVKQLQKSIGRLLKIKPDLSADLLEVIAIVENEKVMRRALEALWWIGKPSLGHHTLGEKFIPLDYESVLLTRQSQQELGEAEAVAIGPRMTHDRTETMFSFRRGSLEENTSPRIDSAVRSSTVGSFRVRTKLPYGRSLPWRATHGPELISLSNMPQQQSMNTTAGMDFLADHELYPYMFSVMETSDQETTQTNVCERCEMIMKGIGLYCYHCRDSIHLECFYAVKRHAGIDCTQLGCALDYVTRHPRNQLIYPDESDIFENPCNKIYVVRAGHHLQLVNLFSTCLCSCCKLPLWGHHHQAYRCQDCAQLMHLDCKGATTKCAAAVQPVTLRNSFPTQISYGDLRQSFREFYQNLISTEETLREKTSGPISSPCTPLSAHASDGDTDKERYSFEEASCTASVLTLQLELLQAGITRGEIQVPEWTQSGQGTDPNSMATSDLELVTLQRHFMDLVQTWQHPSPSSAHSLFLSDFYEDSKPDQFLLFSPAYWSHFAALTKTMLTETEAGQWSMGHQFFPLSSDEGRQEEDIFAIGLDAVQEKLLTDQSVKSASISLASVFRFCMRQLGFQSTWSMQQVLQEWVKIGLLERLDGELCLFESIVQDAGQSAVNGSSELPTLYRSTYDGSGQSNNIANYRSVHCLFPIVTAIDPTPDVENLIHAVWRCLSSVDLAVNECGFLLLTRQCWPDPFMSDYTAERLVGCIFHWLLLEDDQLFVIHKNYASKGKGIPGVRSSQEDYFARKRILLGGLGSSGSTVTESTMTGTSSTSAYTASSTAVNSSTVPGTNSTNYASARNDSTHSNHFGAVGSYVMTRKLMAKKFAIPWLKKTMDLDPERYQEIVYRQMRVLEREMAAEGEVEAWSLEEEQKFRHAQAERHLEIITKLRQSGFLFSAFSSVLSQWLENVEAMLEGVDLNGKNFKNLNRLFLKANSRCSSGFGRTTSVNPVASGHAMPASTSFSRGTTGENEWRNRLRSKLQSQQDSLRGSIQSQSPTNSDSTPEPESVVDLSTTSAVESTPKQFCQGDEGETPLSSLRSMLNEDPSASSMKKTLHWLDIMVHSGVQVPAQAFMELCESVVSMSRSPVPERSDSMAEPVHTSTINQTQATALEQSKIYLKICWESIVTSSARMTETEAGRILDKIVTANQGMILRVLDEGAQGADAGELACQLNRSASATGGFLPLLKQPHHREHNQTVQQVALDRNSVVVDMLLKCLCSSTLSIQSEIIRSFAAMIEHATRVSNMDEFLDTIHMDIVPCLWDLLSPLNDHMADTTLPLLIRFICNRPEYFHKTIACYFADPDWEVRFCALDSVFGLFSKLDDALVLKLFFQHMAPANLRSPGSMTGKMKGTERHQKQPRTGTGLKASVLETDERTSTGLSAELMGYAQFSSEHLRVLGPVFSHFVSSMWDKEDAVRTKAKALLRSLQPVHVCHALKSWELHFVASAPEVQQTMLKLMTRLNNYFPSWRIMDYGLIFKLLTNGGLGRSLGANSTLSLARHSNEVGRGAMTPGSGGGTNIIRPDESTAAAVVQDTDPLLATATKHPGDFGTRRSSDASLPTDNDPLPEESTDTPDAEDISQSRRLSAASASSLEMVPPMVAIMPAGEPSRQQRRASVISAALSFVGSEEVTTTAGEAEAREKQLALEDDVQCSLLNLALQMVANGIEPRLDEVIQLKYLVVFYLDFEGCELVSLGHGKFQVRYGEYIPRQRFSPIHGRAMTGDADEDDGMLNDPGHETFVLAICMNLQLILDRYIEIKPDYEVDPSTLYDQIYTEDMDQHGGTGHEYEIMRMLSDQHTSSPTAGRTFSSTSATTAEFGKASSRTTYSGSHFEDEDISQDGVDQDESDEEHHHRHEGLFCFPRRSQRRDERHHDHQRRAEEPPGQRSIPSQRNTYHYQQHHHQHHHYRRNPNRRYDENTPVVGTYFVDVILRFFGSETDLSVLPAGRLKNWLELLLIVVYKFVKEVDPLSDLVVVLMKRVVEMLMVKKGAPSTNASASMGTHAGISNGNTAMLGAVSTSTTGEESMSEENILLAISICSTLLKRSSTMTTALLSREIMAMGRLMTKRRDDPEDPVLIRAKTFLHDAFVHFMGNGLFVLVFKTQPAHDFNSLSWEERNEGRETDTDLDLFYVLATVLGENEMVPLEPNSSASSGSHGSSATAAAANSASNAQLVHIRDQPIRDIVDRVMIFKDLDPVQVSTILTNLALYVERVHSRLEDLRLLPDMNQFLIKLTKYTTEWDQQQLQKQKEQAQQQRQAQDQKQQQTPLQSPPKKRATHGLFSVNAPTMGPSSGSGSNGCTTQLQMGPKQKPGVMSVNSGSTIAAVTDADKIGTTVVSLPNVLAQSTVLSMAAEGPQRQDTVVPETLTSTMVTSVSSAVSSASQPQRQPTQRLDEQEEQTEEQVEHPSSRRKQITLKNVASFDVQSNLYTKYSRQNTTMSTGSYPVSQSSSSDRHPFRHGPQQQQPSQNQSPTPSPKRVLHSIQHWDYVNPVLNMCSTLMIQNPEEGHHLITAVKHVLKQALYRDKISAPVMIRLLTAYCYVAELDFSLQLVNVFGEFIVDELKISILNNARGHSGRYDPEGFSSDHWRGDELGDDPYKFHLGRMRKDSRTMSLLMMSDKEKSSKTLGAGMTGDTAMTGVSLGLGVGGGQRYAGRTKILASNFHLLHHLLIWDQDPSYNLEWTRIKWGILGSMRFPPGHPILLPGANEALRQETSTIIADWVEA
ncbi:hypothetical protein BGX28_006884 [Mortierella sp. GBA30]|nr:hypothetical protein BGX28_006884 [Mortierella sp. GBA30]